MGIVVPVLLQRDSAKIDMVLGKKRKAPSSPQRIDWSNCPLAKRYPSWETWHRSLKEEREEAAAEGRAPHPAAAPPPKPLHVNELLGPVGGPTVSQMKREYGSKD